MEPRHDPSRLFAPPSGLSPQSVPAPRNSLLRDRNVAWLMGGATVSMLGDQFTLVALPWLVLRMTGDTMVLGTVMALLGVPRALFILLGGAVVDRHSPKRVLMLSKHVNTVLLGALTLLVLFDRLTLRWCTCSHWALACPRLSAFRQPPRCCRKWCSRINCQPPTA